MIAIIDYGVGNLASVRNALIKLGHEAVISSSPEQILQADRVVLPGVGAFGDAMNNLSRLGLDKTVKQVIASGTRLLGICLGLQLLFTEGGTRHPPGFGYNQRPGEKFNLPRPYKVPHMGWNQVYPRQDSVLFKGLLLLVTFTLSIPIMLYPRMIQ